MAATLVHVWAVAALLVAAAPCGSGLGTWSVVGGDFLTTDVSVCFSSEDVGYAAGDINGVGPAVFKTVNGGKEWVNENASFILEVLPLGCAAAHDKPLVVVGGVVGEMYTKDAGKSWLRSFGGEVTQSVRHVGRKGVEFGLAGQQKNAQGVAVSTDGGVLFTAYDANLTTLARYAAYPTDDIWYVAAGQWPQDTVDGVVQPRSPRRRSVYQDAEGHWPRHYNRTAEAGVGGDGYMAEIAKTTDGGKTWRSLFLQEDTFYLNGIDCSPSDPNHCCAVGEASDGPQKGAQILCTTDGEEWKQMVYYNGSSTEGYTLMELRFVSEKEIWAVGGTLTVIAPAAWFLHSLDGGVTWQHAAAILPGRIALALDVIDSSTAYSAVDDVLTQRSGVAKYTKPSAF